MEERISPALRAKLETDGFARLLGAELLDVKPGHARMALDLKPEHHGTPGVTHGGTVFALAEAALAAATHAYNLIHLALSVNIVFHSTTRAGDRLIADVRPHHSGKRTATYNIEIRDQNDTLVASLQAVVYRTKTPLITGKS